MQHVSVSREALAADGTLGIAHYETGYPDIVEAVPGEEFRELVNGLRNESDARELGICAVLQRESEDEHGRGKWIGYSDPVDYYAYATCLADPATHPDASELLDDLARTLLNH